MAQNGSSQHLKLLRNTILGSSTALCFAGAVFGQETLPTVNIEATAEDSGAESAAIQKRLNTTQNKLNTARKRVADAEAKLRLAEEQAAKLAKRAQALADSGGSQYSDPQAPFRAVESGNSRLQGSLMDAPRTVTAITQEVLETTNTTSVRQIARTTPGISLGFGEGGSSFGDNLYIRGFKANNDIYQDGVRDPGISAHETFATEQVEVIKGAAGSIGGRGTTGGAVDIISKSPQDVSFTRSTTTVTDTGTSRSELDINQAISDGFQVRLNYMFQDGVVAGRDSIADDREGLAVAGKLKLSSGTVVELNKTVTKLEGVPDWGVTYIEDENLGIDGPITEYGVPRNTFYGVEGKDFQKVEQDLTTAKISHDFDFGTLTSTIRDSKSNNAYIVTAPSRGDTNGSSDPADWTLSGSTKSRNQSIDSFSTVSELNGDFSLGETKHNYIFGVATENTKIGSGGIEYNSESFEGIAFDSPLDCATSINALTPDRSGCWNGVTPTLSAIRPAGEVNTNSIYIMDKVAVNDRLTISGGVRFDSYKHKKIGYQRDENAPDAPSLGDYGAVNTETNPNRPARWDQSGMTDQQKTDYANAYNAWDAANPESAYVSNEAEEELVNWNLGATYALRDSVNVFAAVSTSSNPPGTEIGAGGGDYGGLDASRMGVEKNMSYELGAKAEIRDGLAVTASVFQTSKKDAFEGCGRGCSSQTLAYNVSGVELGIAGNVNDKLSVFGGLTSMKSDITDSSNADNVGKSLANISHEQATLMSMFSITDRLALGGRATWTGGKDLGTLAPNGNKLPGRTVLDAFGEYAFSDVSVVKFGVTNLADQTSYDTGYRSGSPFVYVAPGRETYVTVDFKF